MEIGIFFLQVIYSIGKKNAPNKSSALLIPQKNGFQKKSLYIGIHFETLGIKFVDQI